MFEPLQLIAFSRRLWNCRRATAGMEFALVLPVMLGVYAGVVEMNGFMNVYLRVNQTAYQLEDLVGRQLKFTDGTPPAGTTKMATLCSLAGPIFASGTGTSLTNLSIKIFDATTPSVNTTTVQWEATSTTTSTTVSCARKTTNIDSLTLPADMTDPAKTPGTSSVAHLAVTVSFPYATILSATLLNSLHVIGSAVGITGPLAALNGRTISVTVYGVPRPPVTGGIPYN